MATVLGPARSLILLFLSAGVLVGSTGPTAIAQVVAEQASEADGSSTSQAASRTESARARNLTTTAKVRLFWARLNHYERQGSFKLALGLLGAVVFLLALTRSRTVLRLIPTPVALAVVTTLMLCLVGTALQSLASGVAGWATPAAIGCAVLGVAWLGFVFATRRRPSWPSLVRRGALVTVLLSGALAWTTFGVFHFGQFVQMHEFFHYFIGSKYFPENRYLRIYRCAVVAEQQDGFSVTRRRVRNLETNQGGMSDQILARGTDCLDVFSAERWDAFRQDVRLFKQGMKPARWVSNFIDKGYNATPFWTSIGSRLSNWNWEAQVPAPELEYSPAALRNVSSESRARRGNRFGEDRRDFKVRLALLSMIDPLLYVAAFALVYWAFGLEACALMALLLGVGGPWDFRYTGGAFARIPWFFTTVAAVCLVKKGYQAWGGGTLVASAMLRLFPAMLFGGVALTAAVRAVRQRTITRAHMRLALGALIGLAVLVPVSMSSGGPRIYAEFMANTERHASTPLTNHAGVRALFSLDMDQRLRVSSNPRLPDSLAPWREARIETFLERERYYWICAALLIGLVWAAARKMTDWERLIAGTLLVITLVDLTSYYLLFMVLWAPLVSRNIRYTLLAIIMAMLTQMPLMAIDQADLRDLVQSVIVIAFMCTVLGLIVFDRGRKVDADLQDTPSGAAVDPI